MFRSQCYRLISIHSNRLQSNTIKTSLKKYLPNSLALLQFSSDVKFGNNNIFNNKNNESNLLRNKTLSENLAEIRERRLRELKRIGPEGEYDILTEAIIKSSSIDEMLELISLHNPVMNNRHLTESFESFHDIIRISNDSDEDTLKMLSSPQFQQLCSRALKRMRYFQPSEILTTLKSLLYIKVSPNTLIIQSLLQMARQLINDFTLDQIIFLDFLLSKRLNENIHNVSVDDITQYSNDLSSNENQKQSIFPLVEALKLALPLVLQVKIESKELDFDDIDLVVKCLRMGARHNVKDEVINKLTAAVSIKMEELTVQQLLSVVASLTNLRYPHSNINHNLVDRVTRDCLDRVTAPGVPLPDESSYKFIISLITYSRDRRVYYHKGLFEMVANLIVNNADKIDIFRSCQALWALTKHGHVNYALLDLIAEQIASNNPLILSSHRISIVNILNAFSLPSNYNPNKHQSDVFYESIIKSANVQFFYPKNKALLIKMLKYLFLLNSYPKEFINDCILNHLDEAIASSTINGMRTDILQTIGIVYQGLCLESNDMNDNEMQLLKERLKPFINEWINYQSNELKDQTRSESLHRSLTQGLGGQQFVANNLFTEFGHCVDHCVVMRKGGYPVAVGEKVNNITLIRQLELPSDSKIIGIIPLNQRDFCRFPSILRKDTEFKMKTLKKAGVIPLPMNLESWDSLLERERIPYLMREIQESSLTDTKLTNIS